MRTTLATLAALLACGPAAAIGPILPLGATPPAPYLQLGRTVMAELVGIDSTHAKGSTGVAKAIRARFLAAGFPAADMQLVAPPGHPDKGNLVLRVHGKGKTKPVLFIGHIDVVEVDRKAWSTDPFKLTEKDGFFFGRGTEDMKGEDAELIAALIRLRKEGYVPDRDLIFAFTADEEAGGDQNGVQYLYDHDRKLIDASIVFNVDGGGGRMMDGKRAFVGVETSEKLYVTYQFYTENPGGHSSIPRPDNAIYQMTAALDKLAAFHFPTHTTPTSRALFHDVAALTPAPQNMLFQAVSAPIPDERAATALSTDPLFNALLRTTCVATVINGGFGESALANHVHTTVQCRLIPGETPEATLATLHKVVNDPGVKITMDGPILPSPDSPLDPDLMGRIKRAADNVWGNMLVIPELEPGASDCIYPRGAGVDCYDAPLIFIDQSRAHARDERVPVQAFDEGGEFAHEIIKSMGAAK